MSAGLTALVCKTQKAIKRIKIISFELLKNDYIKVKVFFEWTVWNVNSSNISVMNVLEIKSWLCKFNCSITVCILNVHF